MMAGGTIRRQPLKWLLFVGLWTVIGLSFASQFYISSSKLNRPVSWGYALNYSLLDWYVFGLLSLPAIWLARHFRLERQQWEQSVPVHLAASIAFSLLYVVLRAWVAQMQARWVAHVVTFPDAFQPL